MESKYKFYSITDYEWLEPTTDASRLIINYSIADDAAGSMNRIDRYIIAELTLSAEVLAGLDNPSDKVVTIIGYLQNKIESSLRDGDEPPTEIEINSYDDDFPPNILDIRFNIEEWNRIEISRGFSFE